MKRRRSSVAATPVEPPAKGRTPTSRRSSRRRSQQQPAASHTSEEADSKQQDAPLHHERVSLQRKGQLDEVDRLLGAAIEDVLSEQAKRKAGSKASLWANGGQKLVRGRVMCQWLRNFILAVAVVPCSSAPCGNPWI